MAEWNLPPVRFSRVGTPGAYLTWARPALFASGLVTNVDSADARRTVMTMGGQLDFRFTILSRLDLTLSAEDLYLFGAGRLHQAYLTLGARPMTLEGVPVTMISPGSSVMPWVM